MAVFGALLSGAALPALSSPPLWVRKEVAAASDRPPPVEDDCAEYSDRFLPGMSEKWHPVGSERG